jgi:hypothetical protein
MQVKPIFGDIIEKIDKTYCFVLMPFQKTFFQVFEDHILKVSKKFKLICEKADDIYSTKAIMDDIWKSINRAKIIIADLSEKNANVLYETGIAHTLGKDVILLTREIKDIPFDLRHLRTIRYDFTPRGMKEFEKSLGKTLNELLKNEVMKIQTKKKSIPKVFRFTKNGDSMLLWKEKIIKKQDIEYLSYEIPLKKNSTLKGHIVGDNIFHFYLVDKFNKNLFEQKKIFKSNLNSVSNLEYNFHFKSYKDEKVFLMIGAEQKDSIKFDISLYLEHTKKSDVEIIWDETAHANFDDRMNYYPIKAKMNEVINVELCTNKISNMYLLDSSNWVLYNQKSTHKKIIEKTKTKTARFKYKCKKDDLWIVVAEPPPGMSMEIKAFITKSKK